MSFNSFYYFKKVVLLFFLLMPSIVICAESPETSGVKSETTGDIDSQRPQMTNNFPRWPEHQQVERDVVPPPPPGPYMSLGLNDFPVSETSFSRNSNKQQLQLDSSGAPIQTFSPDAPWPKYIRPTKRWMPEDGYQYVTPKVEKNLYPVQRQPAGNYYGYPGSPYMTWPGANWAPSAGAGPVAPYRGYSPRYNNSVNNNRLQQANPAYRAPYPAPSKP
jgi:hypothetical protein